MYAQLDQLSEINSDIGTAIDSSERKTHGLFPHYDDSVFKSAQFFKKSDGSMYYIVYKADKTTDKKEISKYDFKVLRKILKHPLYLESLSELPDSSAELYELINYKSGDEFFEKYIKERKIKKDMHLLFYKPHNSKTFELLPGKTIRCFPENHKPFVGEYIAFKDNMLTIKTEEKDVKIHTDSLSKVFVFKSDGKRTGGAILVTIGYIGMIGGGGLTLAFTGILLFDSLAIYGYMLSLPVLHNAFWTYKLGRLIQGKMINLDNWKLIDY
jgi:hypothetical protein